MEKKAQVTIFVIIGAVILLGAVLIFTLNQEILKDKPGLDQPAVDLEARPAVNIVRSCLEKVGQEAVKKIGAQGGTFYPPSLSYPPYRSKSVEFPPNIIPYWRYLDSCDENIVGCERVYEPPLCKSTEPDCGGLPSGDDSIQEQLELYVEKYLPNCVADFSEISDQYNITITAKPDVSVIFGNNDTIMTLSYPIKITSFSTGNTQEYDNYKANIGVSLREVYKLADDIIRFERKTNFYETKTMDLISIYSGLHEKLPPTNEITFFSPLAGPWIQSEVKDLIRYDLLPFMNLITFVNTKNFRPLIKDDKLGKYDVYSQGIYKGMTPKISDTEIYKYNVYHHYLYQDILLQINDGKQVIMPSDIFPEDNLLLKLSGLFMKDYRFKYHLSYPLIVTINDDNAFDGEGFDFNFAVEVNIRNNVPAYRNFTSLDISVPHETSIGDIAVRLPQNITIFTSDKHTKKGLGDVRISYVCGKEYELGVTRMQANGQASFTTQLPYCELGGAIRYQKQGYLGESIEYNNKLGGGNKEFSVGLWPVMKKEVFIKKRTVKNVEDLQALGTNEVFYRDQLAENLTKNELVLFNIERVKTSPYDTDVPQIGFLRYQKDLVNLSRATVKLENSRQAILDAVNDGYYDNETAQELLANLEDSAETPEPIIQEAQDHYYLEFVPGNYTFEATLIDTSGLHIPAEKMIITGGEDGGIQGAVGDLIVKDKEINLQEMNFSMWIEGGAKMNMSYPEFYLYNNKPITFYVLEMTHPKTWSDFDDLEELEDYQVGKEKFLRPKRN